MKEELGAALLSVLSNIEDRLTEIRDLSRAQVSAGKVLDAEDRLVLSDLLPGIAELLGDGIFTVKELVAEADEYEPLQARLTRALGQGWQNKLKAFGKLLARADGATVDGWMLTRVGDSREGAIWRISDVRRSWLRL